MPAQLEVKKLRVAPPDPDAGGRLWQAAVSAIRVRNRYGNTVTLEAIAYGASPHEAADAAYALVCELPFWPEKG